MPRKIIETDAEIASMFGCGTTQKRLVTARNVSSCAIGAAVKRARDKERMDKDAMAFREKVKRANDPRRKWDAARLMNALGFERGRAGKQMARYFEEKGCRRVSLHDVMEILLPDPTSGARRADHLIPALRIRCLGKVACMRMIEAMNTLDIEPAFDVEWRRRKIAFRDLATGNKVSITLRQIMQVAERMNTQSVAEPWRGRRK